MVVNGYVVDWVAKAGLVEEMFAERGTEVWRVRS